MKIRIHETINDPGRTGGHSEDRFGWNDDSVFVIDGATGIAEHQVMAGHSSDAAWLAGLAADSFTQAGHETISQTVEALNSRARDLYFKEAGTGDLPRYAWPAAAFQMLRIEGRTLVTYGLGDSRLFLMSDDTGEVFETSALKQNRDREAESARAHLQRIGGFRGEKDIKDDPQTLSALRAGRSRHNTPDGNIFTLGLVPEAAGRIVREETGLTAPVHGLLCSDGFAALCDLYEAFTPQKLIRAAHDQGLVALIERLRTIERSEDPEGERFPRFKVSDDATCVAFSID